MSLTNANADHPRGRRVRIGFPLSETWHGHAIEWLHAEKVGRDRYQLMNSPFYAKGVSWLDEVEAKPTEDGLMFVRPLQQSGHSTYRLFLNRDLDDQQVQEHWALLAAIGCTYERATEHLLTVDVPPSASVSRAFELMNEGQADSVWDFEEGHVGHPL